MKQFKILALSTVATFALSGAAMAQGGYNANYNDATDYNDASAYEHGASYNKVDVSPKTSTYKTDIAYITGGIGEEEQQQFKAARSDYNTQMLFADRSTGAYLANVKVDIMDKSGNTIFSNISEGPYMYVDLPKGSYTVKASFEGTEHSRNITVGQNNSKNLHFLWDTAI